MPVRRFCLLLGLALVPFAVPGMGCGKKKPKAPGCTKDTDCKGNRICEQGTCVNPGTPDGAGMAAAAAPGKPGRASRPRARAQAGAGPSRPGPGISPPRAGGAPVPGSPALPGGIPDFRVCVGSQCVSLGGQLGRNPADMGKLFQLLSQLMMDSVTKGSRPGAKAAPKVRVCVGNQCVTVDEKLKRDPSALMRLIMPLAPALLQQLLQGSLGPRGGLGPGGPSGPLLPPSQRPPPRSGGAPLQRPSPRSRGAVLNDFASVSRLGPRAVGREVLLAGVRVTSVSDERLVLEGPGQEMIVLRIPRAARSLLPALRLATGKLTVRLRVLSPPIGKILHGVLLGLK